MANFKDPEDTLVYVLLFPNPFEKNNEFILGRDIRVADAHEKFFKIYKTSANDTENPIPAICEQQILWLKDCLTDEGKGAIIYFRDFMIAVISSVLYTISKELGLTYKLLSSRDKDEVFCKIYASEKWLRQRAEKIDYLLAFKNFKENKKEFMKVPPFGSINLEKTEKEKLFKFYDPDGDEIEKNGSFFTYHDKARLVLNALFSKINLSDMQKFEVMKNSFCLHTEMPLRKVKYLWARIGALCNKQPYDQIRLYFSDKPTLYFEWIGVYFYFMIIAAVIGIVFFVLNVLFESDKSSIELKILTVAFAVFLSFWASVFDQYWVRKEKILAWQWGKTSLKPSLQQRKDYKGKFVRDEMTGKMRMAEIHSFLSKIRKLLSYLSIICIIICVIGTVASIFLLKYILSSNDLKTFGQIFAATLNAIQIRVLNILYKKLALILNNWENYETDSLYEENLAIKLFLFKFVNSYSSLYYMAFLKPGLEGCETSCLDELSLQLLVIFCFNMFCNFVELLMPWFKVSLRKSQEDRKVKKELITDSSIRQFMYPVECDSKLEDYEGHVDDYITMIIQFGYVALFGATVPLLPFIAAIEVLFKIRIDAIRLCSLTKRPNPSECNTIGVYRKFILFIAFAGAVSNSGIIFITTDLFSEGTFFDQLVGFAVLEHFLIVGMMIINVVIPDHPQIVSDGLNWSKRIVEEKSLNYKARFSDNQPLLPQFNQKFWIEPTDVSYQQ